MLKFVFNVEKLKSHQIHLAKGHNQREGYCASQIKNKIAWFGHDGRKTVVEWNTERLSEAHKLAKRKDAVEAISIILQVGNQTDWRDTANRECAEGLPKKTPPADQNKLANASKEWAEKEFGKENVVSIEAHLDESSPHFHVIITPIKNGKLQAKHWLNGPADVAALRSSAHKAFNLVVPCEYEPGREGGEAHDPGKAAGKDKSPNRQQKPEKPTGLFARLSGVVEDENQRLLAENRELLAENHILKQKIQYGTVKKVKASMLESAEQQIIELQASLDIANQALQLEKNHRIQIENDANATKRLLNTLTPEQLQWTQQEADRNTIARIATEKRAQKIESIGDLMLEAALNKAMVIYAFEELDKNLDLHLDLRERYKNTDLAYDIERLYADYEAINTARSPKSNKTAGTHLRLQETLKMAPTGHSDDFDCPL